MHYTGSTSSNSNRGSSSSAWSCHTSSSSVSLPRTPTVGIAALPPSPVTPGNNFNNGGFQPLAPHMGTVSLPPSEPGTPMYRTSTWPFAVRVKTRYILKLNRWSSNTSGESGKRVEEDAFRPGLASNPHIQPCAMHLLQRYASRARTCCASKLHQFQGYDT